MIETLTQVDIVDVPYERLDEAAAVMACAFMDYPLLHLFFADSGENYVQHVREAFHITCEARLALGEIVKGVQVDNRLVAVACIATPGEQQWPASLEQKFEAFAQCNGARSMDLLGRFGELTASYSPAEPHFYLIAPGVHPDWQGQGYGRLLLELVQSLSEAHPTSTGVGLDTETATNVPLYEHCGYRVTTKTSLETVDIWCMVRANRT
jgi:GNAT superfamily N-acetyltransferase